MPNQIIPAIERFNSKYVINEETGCWEWTGSLFTTGYGQFAPSRSVGTTAHRWIWEYLHGPINDRNIYVCHRCDNARCVNPDHLFLGTPKENTMDMIRKGRKVNNPKHGKIDADTVSIIRFLLAIKIKPGVIAKTFLIHPQSITQIQNGTSYRKNSSPETVILILTDSLPVSPIS